MGEMEDKLNTILNNPQIMQSILSMAQSLGQETPAAAPKAQETSAAIPDIDISVLQKIGGLAGQNTIDAQQKELLHALSPYLTRNRVAKLERAMRAAKMAKLASVFLNSGGLQLLTGR